MSNRDKTKNENEGSYLIQGTIYDLQILDGEGRGIVDHSNSELKETCVDLESREFYSIAGMVLEKEFKTYAKNIK